MGKRCRKEQSEDNREPNEIEGMRSKREKNFETKSALIVNHFKTVSERKGARRNWNPLSTIPRNSEGTTGRAGSVKQRGGI